MDVHNAHSLQINDAQFSEVHGDQNTQHHDHSLQIEGQNNTATFLHTDYRGGMDSRIINENCSNMVIFAQGQNCRVTLDSLDLPFLRSWNRQPASQTLSRDVHEPSQLYGPTTEGLHHRVDNNTNSGQMAIGQGENGRVSSGGESPPPSLENQHMVSEDDVTSAITYATESESMLSSIGSHPTTAGTSSAHVCQHDDIDAGSAVTSTSTASLPVTPIVPPIAPSQVPMSVHPDAGNGADVSNSLHAAKATEQTAADCIPESLPSSAAICARNSKEMQQEEHGQAPAWHSRVVSIAAEAPDLEPAHTIMSGPILPSSPKLGSLKTSQPGTAVCNDSATNPLSGISHVAPPMPNKTSVQEAHTGYGIAPARVTGQEARPQPHGLRETESTSRQILSAIEEPKPVKRKNIFHILRQRVLRIFQGSKNDKAS